VTSIKVKDKSLNLIAWPSGDEFGLGEHEMSAFDAVDGSSTGTCVPEMWVRLNSHDLEECE
jgi:hypothetical protein